MTGTSLVTMINQLATKAEHGSFKAIGQALRLLATAAAQGEPLVISSNQTITELNAATFNGKTLVFAGAYTVTLNAGLPQGFGFVFKPPESGSASIASDGTVQLNGGTATLTRDLATTSLVGVAAVGDNSYTVTGS